MMLCLLAGCGGPGGAPPGALDLGGAWKIIATDDTAPALPGYDDSRAGTLELPGGLEHILARSDDYSATVWFRKKIFIGSGQAPKMMVLTLNGIGTADEAYVNGSFVGGSGAFPPGNRPLGYDSAWHRDRHYRFSSSLLKPGAENIIALKVYFHMINGVRERPALSTIEDWSEAYRFREYFPSANNLYPLALSFLLFLLLAVTMKGTVNVKVALNSTVFIFAVFGVTVLMLGLPRFDNNIYRFKLFFFLYVLADFALLLFIQEFFTIKSRVMTALAAITLAAFTVFIALVPSSRVLIAAGAPVTAGVITAYIAAALGVFVTALYQDPRRYWYLAIVAVVILVSAANTLLCLATGRIYLLSFSFALRLPLLMFAALLVYLLDLKNIRKERDSLTRALLKKTKELREAKRKAPKGDVKPEPRDAIHGLIEHLDSNFTATYDRIALARRFNMNEDYMVQLFKKVTGTNISSHINVKRIEAAMQLLNETESKVIDIAFHVGFDNLTYFYRNFKKHTGYSPVEYRRRMRDRLFTDEEIMME
jgi:AraC-like DNA-binding protein